MTDNDKSDKLADYAAIMDISDNKKPETDEIISFTHVIGIFRKYALNILLISIILTIVIAGMMKLTETESYSYRGILHVLPNIDEAGLDVDSINLRYLGFNDSIRNIAQLVTDDSLVLDAMKDAGFDVIDASQWVKNSSVAMQTNTGLIYINVTSKDAIYAEALNNSLIRIVRNKIEEIYPHVLVKINSPAVLSINDDKLQLSLPVIAVIFVFSCFIVFLIYLISCFFGSKVNSESDIRKSSSFPLIIRSQKGAEPRTALLTYSIFEATNECSGFKTYACVSFSPDSQAVRITEELAALLHSKGRKVLMIDMDFKDQSLSSLKGLAKNKGVSDILQGRLSGDDVKALITNSDGVDVLPMGGNMTKSEFVRQIDSVRRLIDTVKDSYDTVFINVVPLSYSSENIIISSFSDTSLLFLRQNAIAGNVIEDASRILVQLKSDVRGFILTDVFLM